MTRPVAKPSWKLPRSGHLWLTKMVELVLESIKLMDTVDQSSSGVSGQKFRRRTQYIPFTRRGVLQSHSTVRYWYWYSYGTVPLSRDVYSGRIWELQYHTGVADVTYI